MRYYVNWAASVPGMGQGPWRHLLVDTTGRMWRAVRLLDDNFKGHYIASETMLDSLIGPVEPYLGNYRCPTNHMEAIWPCGHWHIFLSWETDR